MARRPRVTISTMHGVASAVVMITDLPGPSPKAQAAPADVIVRDCRVEPVVSLVPESADVRLASADLRRHRVELVADGAPSAVASWKPPAAPPAGIDLAWAGAEVSLPAIHPIAWRVTTDAAPDDASWIVVPDALASLTGDDGDATFASVPAGTHHVIAWLPERGDGAQTRVVAVDVTVAGGVPAELTIDLGTPAPAASPPPSP